MGWGIIESVDSVGSTIYAISKDERGFPLTQYITTGEYLAVDTLSRI